MKVGSKLHSLPNLSTLLTSNKEPKSKRVPVRLRHKIEKASAAKQKKERKLAKKVRRARETKKTRIDESLESAMAIKNEKGSWHS